ncbi:MAG TPA: hypothetical protein DEH78_20750 [Solibacterales bacterium]|nr:hypothetical protein [Bryobacterales bacterium]
MDSRKEELRRYAQQWASNAPWLEAIRDREIREADTAASIRMFDQAFRSALRELPPRTSSGLVEWQDFVRRWRDRDG